MQDSKRINTDADLQYGAFPVEITSLMLSFLTPRAREKLRCVCKTWDRLIRKALELDHQKEDFEAFLARWFFALMFEKTLKWQMQFFVHRWVQGNTTYGSDYCHVVIEKGKPNEPCSSDYIVYFTERYFDKPGRNFGVPPRALKEGFNRLRKCENHGDDYDEKGILHASEKDLQDTFQWFMFSKAEEGETPEKAQLGCYLDYEINCWDDRRSLHLEGPGLTWAVPMFIHFLKENRYANLRNYNWKELEDLLQDFECYYKVRLYLDH